MIMFKIMVMNLLLCFFFLYVEIGFCIEQLKIDNEIKVF